MAKQIGSTYASTLQALKDTVKRDAPHCGVWGVLLPSWAMAMRQARKLAAETRYSKWLSEEA